QVVQHCVSCLGAVVNRVTHNYKFVWACFNRYYGALTKLKSQHQEEANSSALVGNKPALLRSLFTVGALCRHFDFDREEFKGNTKVRSALDPVFNGTQGPGCTHMQRKAGPVGRGETG
uniref:Nipped-B-like protein A n=1 Tax=Callorhinchus milii TaxID=7868 RepID=A0A4W3GWK8_CALMI